jgi:3-dehydroquinate synthetase
MILPFPLLSQVKKDTSMVCLPYSVAKQVALDLNKLDSIIEINNLTNEELKQTERKVIYKDSIITVMKEKEVNYETIITKEREKFKIVDDQNTNLRDELTKVRRRRTFLEIFGGAVIGTLGGILILK